MPPPPPPPAPHLRPVLEDGDGEKRAVGEAAVVMVRDDDAQAVTVAETLGEREKEWHREGEDDAHGKGVVEKEASAVLAAEEEPNGGPKEVLGLELSLTSAGVGVQEAEGERVGERVAFELRVGPPRGRHGVGEREGSRGVPVAFFQGDTEGEKEVEGH